MHKESTLSIGTTLKGRDNTYTIRRVLGQGSFGITYLATTTIKFQGPLGEIESEIPVAVKEFFMREINGREGSSVTFGSKGGIYEKYKHKFATEAHNLSRLKHPGIVKVIESFEANDTFYYTMEYCEGGSLDELIGKSGGITEQQAKEYILSIASALEFMHSEKMLHLDLKPSNVMLSKKGELKLIDFGLSKQYDESGNPESSTTIGGGTPGYAPIEQSNYKEGAEFPVTMDIYALGATLFKLLTGKRPPESSVILNEGFPTEALAKAGVTSPIIALIQKAMSPTKRDRHQSIREFIDELNQEQTIVKPEPEPQPEPEPEPEPLKIKDAKSKSRKLKEKKPTHIIIAIIIAIIVCGGFFYMLVSGPEATLSTLSSQTEAPYAVGDYYNENGKQGVVYEVSDAGYHGKIVNLSGDWQKWCSDSQYSKAIVVGASSLNDGEKNTQKILSRADNSQYHAAMWCSYLGSCWYIPAKNELVKLLANRNAINPTIVEYGGKEIFEGDYWSSSEHSFVKGRSAWFVSTRPGRLGCNDRCIGLQVRAISRF